MDISKPISAWTLIFGLLIGDKVSFARFTFGQCLKNVDEVMAKSYGQAFVYVGDFRCGSNCL